MRDFRSGKVTTLVATDVAGRGLHISRCCVFIDHCCDLHTYLNLLCRMSACAGMLQLRRFWCYCHRSRCCTYMSSLLVPSQVCRKQSAADSGLRGYSCKLIRGINCCSLPLVVNYDFPGNLQTYVHRVGRAGRLAADGHAMSFITRNMAPLAASLLALLQVGITTA